MIKLLDLLIIVNIIMAAYIFRVSWILSSSFALLFSEIGFTFPKIVILLLLLDRHIYIVHLK